MRKKFLGLVGLMAVGLSTRGSVIFDDFESGAGHFNTAPNFSGTSNINASSTAAVVTPSIASPQGGKAMELTLNLNVANPARDRFLSGSGTPANNTAITLTASQTNGFIGFYAKTSASGITFSISLDDSTNTGGGMDGGKPITATADGDWHLYEWNLDDSTQWTSVAGVGGGHATGGLHGTGGPQAGTHTIDDVYVNNITANNTVVDFDFVAKSDSGSVATLVPEPASLSVAGLAGLGLLSRRRKQTA